MRFKQYLNERSAGLTFDEVIKEIKLNCQPFLTENVVKPLYRAVSERYLRTGYTPHPQSRAPRDSGKEFNFTFNAGYQAAFGIPSVRTRSVFATGNAAMTSEYGELAFFFPAGKFKFGHSPIFRDSYENENKLEKKIGEKFFELCNASELGPTMARPYIGMRVTELFEMLQAEMSPAAWVKNQNDVGEDMTLKCAKELLAMNPQSDFTKVKSLHAKLVETLRSVFELVYKDNASLSEAIYSNHEILFYETAGYYLVPYEKVIEVMDDQGLGVMNRDERYWFVLDSINSV